MATVAFLPSPMTGHVNPFLGIGKELADAGHRVVWYLPEDHRRAVTVAGGELRSYTLVRHRPHRPGDDAMTRFARVPMWLTAECRQVLPQIADDVRALAPDVIVYDMLCVWGRLLARLLPGPAAMVVGSYVGNEHFSPTNTAHYQAMAGRLAETFADYAADVAALGETYGLQLRPRDLFARDERLVVVVMPREFHPAGDTFDDRFRFIGVSSRPAGCDPPDGLADQAFDRPVVYVSCGTVVGLPEKLLEQCLEAFADGRWRVVIALDDTEPRRPVPPHVTLATRVCQLDLLPRADAFVTHGGTNSVMEALLFGVPLVVLPAAPEHAITADRVAELGLGLCCDPGTLTADALRAAVDHVATSAAVRESLARMREAVRAAGGAAAAARAIVESSQVFNT
jgi:MGT family glycosyltransferase